MLARRTCPGPLALAAALEAGASGTLSFYKVARWEWVFKTLRYEGSQCRSLLPCRSTELEKGDTFRRERSFSLEDVEMFFRLCKNTYSINLELDRAKDLGLANCVVPELLYAGLFPAIIGTQFPRSVYVSQNLEFKRPVCVGEPLLAEVKAVSIRQHRNKYRVAFATNCWVKADMTLVIDGTAVALLETLLKGG